MDIEQIDPSKYTGKHNFLAEELLIPNVNKCDSNRVNMFTSHIAQAVVLEHSEVPKIFTNFENQVGKYSSGYRMADRNWTVVSKIIKNEQNMLLILKDEEGNYDVVERKPAERITEYFGYRNHNDGIDEVEVKDVIEEGKVMHRNTSYDKDMNFGYGVNLKTLYIPWKGMTYEDAIVVSESAAKKLTSYMVEEVTINVNTNDILINIYGNSKNFKSFPDIGETVVNKKIAARRRIDYNSAFFDLSTKNLGQVNHNTDTVFYSEGEIIDIDVFSNASMETLEKYPYNKQILRYMKGNNAYYEKVVKVLKPIVEGKSKKKKYSDTLAYVYKRAKDILDEEVKWRNDKSDFDNLIIRFRVLKHQKLGIGSKLTGRFGNKGVISQILKDEDMPLNENGERAEVLLNPLGVMNRLNIAQLYEHELSFLASYIQRQMAEKEDINERSEILFDFLSSINEEYSNKLAEYYDTLDYEGAEQFFKDIDDKGIYIHQPPFYGNISLEQMTALYDKYPEAQPEKFVGIENPLIMGELYYMKLKHEAKSKFSARSSSYTNLKNIPSKSTSFKENQQLYPKTPIKIGEMELTNLFIGNDVEEVTRFMSLYSINDSDRRHMIKSLLVKNIFDLEEIKLTGDETRTRTILDVYFTNMGLELERGDEEAEPTEE